MANKKTILIYETGLGRGGSKQSLLAWLEMLRASGIFQARILLGQEGWMADQLRVRGFAFDLVPMPRALAEVRHGSWKNRGRIMWSVLCMAGGIFAAWVRTFGCQADAIILTGGRDFLMIAPLVLRLRKRTAVIPQTTDWASIPVCRAMCRVAGHTFAISQAVADSIVAMGISRRKVEVLPWIYTGDRSHSAPTRGDVRAELGLPLDVAVIAMLGVIREQKGQREAVRIFQEIATHRHDARLVIVGAAPSGQPDAAGYEEEVRAAASEFGLESKILFMGWKEDAARLLRGFDVLLVPSRDTEGVPRVILEAFEAGVYVIASALEAFREIFDGVGSLQPLDDTRAWAAAALGVLDDSSRSAAESEKVRALWERRFSETVSVPALLSRLQRLACE